MREEINAMKKKYFYYSFFLNKNEVESRGAQHISLCTLNKVQ